MKRTGFIIIVIVTLLLTASIGGCDSISGIVSSLWSGGKHELRKLDKILKDKTVVPRAYDKLEKMKEARKHLSGRVTEEKADANVNQRQIDREKAKLQLSQNAFNLYHQAATAAGLPHESKATAADLAKEINIEGKTVTGREVYQNLAAYKSEIKTYQQNIAELGGTQSDHIEYASTIASEFPDIDEGIRQLEQTIKTCERLQQKRADAKTIEDLKLEKPEYDSVLKMDEIMTDLERKIDRYRIELGSAAARRNSEQEKKRLTKPKYSITDNDIVD